MMKLMAVCLFVMAFYNTKAADIKVKGIGCFKDNVGGRAFPKTLHWFMVGNDKEKIQECASSARALGFRYFGIQYSNECWSGVNENGITYDSYGQATNCIYGIGGDTSNYVYEILEDPPKIISSPSSVTKTEKESVTLSCEFEGKPMPSVDWLFNGMKLDINSNSRLTVSQSGDVTSATSSLTITNLNRTDEGNYTCVISNSVKSNVASTAAQLIVNYPPSILVSPHHTTTNESSTVTLKCEVEGKPQPTVKWFKNGSPFGSRKTTVSVESLKVSLTIDNVSRSDEGVFSCLASNGIGANVTSAGANVTVNYPPRIITSPHNATLFEYHSMTLKCIFEGKPKSLITWWYNGAQINTSDSAKYSVSGSSSVSSSVASLTDNDLTRHDKGSYSCKAENSLGTVDSQPAFLTVYYSPSLLDYPDNKQRNENESVSWRCEFHGDPLPLVTWKRNGKELSSSGRIQINNGLIPVSENFFSNLNITNLHRTDEGSYTCAVKNAVGTVVSPSSTLTINYSPKILASPSGVTIKEQENVTLSCRCEGKPLPALEWFANGKKLNINSNSRLTVSESGDVTSATSSLTITNLNRTDEGNYTCVISNSVKSNVASAAAQLIVNYPPSILVSPHHTTTNESSTVTLKCEVEGKPQPTVKWFKNGSPFNSRKTTVSVESLKVSLTIDNVSRSDKGVYSCHASNGIGANVMSAGATLTVNYHPKIITSPENVTKIESQSVTFKCTVVGNPISQVTWWYNGAQINTSDSAKYSVSGPSSVSSSEASLTIKNLLRSGKGFYRCKAQNSLGIVESHSAHLTVYFSPKIDHKPVSLTKKESETAVFYCNATGKPKPTISWRFSGGVLPKSTTDIDKITIKSVKNSPAYEGRYTCIASSIAGSDKASASLVVDVPPKINSRLPSKLLLQLGETLKLRCDVMADPQPVFTWKFTNTETKNEILKEKGPLLTIEDIDVVLHAGTYSCTAKNRAGKVHVGSTYVDVNDTLDIIRKDQHNIVADVNTTVTLNCSASSRVVPIEVTLTRNRKNLKTKLVQNQENKVVTRRLVLKHVTTGDSGTYVCEARNRQKVVKAVITLTVNVPVEVKMDAILEGKNFTKELENKSSTLYRNLSRDFERELTEIYKNETEFERIEVLGFSQGSVAVHFRIIYKMKVKSPSEKLPSQVTKIKIANVVLRRVKETGSIGSIRVKKESLKPQVIPPEVRNLTALKTSSTQLTIQWSPPVYSDLYGIKWFIVQLKQFGHNSPLDKNVVNSLVDTYTWTGLDAGTNYRITALGKNHVGEGIPSVLEIKTLPDFWGTFTKVFTPLVIMLIIVIVIATFYLRRRRLSKRELNDLSVRGESFGKSGIELSGLSRKWREISKDDLFIGKELGSGAFGVVFKGVLTSGKSEEQAIDCAVKMLKDGASEEDYKDLYNELLFMASVEENKNIVNLLGACTESGGPLYVIVEFAENGCLLDYLRKNRSDEAPDQASSLPNCEKLTFALEIASGMNHLSLQKCVHRDLAARNVLLGKDMVAKVADFGLSRDVYERGFYEKSVAGGKLPAKWMSIEALETMIATSESDVWSFGVLMWEIESGGKMPHAGLAFTELVKALKDGVRLPKPTNCLEELYTIMKDCWHANPSQRPKFSDLTFILENLLTAYLED